MIITRRGMARDDLSPTDVDRELVTGFVEVDPMRTDVGPLLRIGVQARYIVSP